MFISRNIKEDTEICTFKQKKKKKKKKDSNHMGTWVIISSHTESITMFSVCLSYPPPIENV